MRPSLDEILATWVRYGVSGVKGSKSTIYTVSESLESEINLVITSEGADYFMIPYEHARTILTQGYDLLTWAEEENIRKRMLVNHPTKYSNRVSEVATGFEKRLWIKPSDSISEGVPVISWFIEDAATMDVLPETRKRKMGWRLSLTGAEDIVLSFASWNDVEGIKNLVGFLDKTEQLFGMLCLINPDVARCLRARVDLLRRVNVRGFEEPSRARLSHKLIESGVVGKALENQYEIHLGLLTYEVADVVVPLMIAVASSHVGQSHQKNRKARPISNTDSISTVIEKWHSEWDSLIENRVNGRDGWRVVDLDSLITDRTLWDGTSLNDVSISHWVTNLSDDDLLKILFADKSRSNVSRTKIVWGLESLARQEDLERLEDMERIEELNRHLG